MIHLYFQIHFICILFNFFVLGIALAFDKSENRDINVATHVLLAPIVSTYMLGLLLAYGLSKIIK